MKNLETQFVFGPNTVSCFYCSIQSDLLTLFYLDNSEFFPVCSTRIFWLFFTDLHSMSRTHQVFHEVPFCLKESLFLRPRIFHNLCKHLLLLASSTHTKKRKIFRFKLGPFLSQSLGQTNDNIK